MTDSVQSLLVVGANHRSSALAVRDALFVEDPDIPAALEELRQAGLEQVLLLSTCDRVEVIALSEDPAAAAAAATGWLAARLAGKPRNGQAPADLPAEETGERSSGSDSLRSQLYHLYATDALHHLFCVASSLDSLMIGEPHILGQVKAALRYSRDAALSGTGLESLLQAAFATAKRVRSETSIGEGPVSVAACASQVARDLFGDPGKLRLLLVGGGDMATLVCENLMSHGSHAVTVTARRAGRAEQMARTFSAHIVPYETLPAALAEAEVVITGIGGRTWAITEEAVRQALKKRRQRPILFVDVAIPGDVEPAVNRVDNAFLYDLEDLERLAERSRSQREASARAAGEIVNAEVAAFIRHTAERPASPAIAALHRHFEAERARALAEAPNDAGKATRLLVGRLLHHPSELLRAMAAADSPARWHHAEEMVRLLFSLPADDDKSG